MSITFKGTHAIVLGGSMTGLLTARVLSDHFAQVTLIERDSLPTTVQNRQGVPQGHHAHGLLARGLTIIEQLFPGIQDTLIAAGATSDDITAAVNWYQFGGYKVRVISGVMGVTMTRPLLETQVRQRLRGIPNVTVRAECEVQALVTNANQSQVLGVVCQQREPPQATETLSADLVVDATGRGSHTPRWLESLGYARPTETSVKVNVGYATRFYQRNPAEEGKLVGQFAFGQPPQSKRLGVVLGVEGKRWQVTLGGSMGDYPPTEAAAFMAFARSLPAPNVAQVMERSQPLTDITPYRFPGNLRRHYEKLPRFPERYIVLGDALCSFNPIYGQGMSATALQAQVLDRCLRAGLDELPQRFFKAVTPVVDVPWLMATGEDLRYPEVIGERPLSLRLINWYTTQVHLAATVDAEVCRAFFLVAHLMQPPTSLFKPSLLLRVARARLKGAGAAGAP